jgi:hypothetical protein
LHPSSDYKIFPSLASDTVTKRQYVCGERVKWGRKQALNVLLIESQSHFDSFFSSAKKTWGKRFIAINLGKHARSIFLSSSNDFFKCCHWKNILNTLLASRSSACLLEKWKVIFLLKWLRFDVNSECLTHKCVHKLSVFVI